MTINNEHNQDDFEGYTGPLGGLYLTEDLMDPKKKRGMRSNRSRDYYNRRCRGRSCYSYDSYYSYYYPYYYYNTRGSSRSSRGRWLDDDDGILQIERQTELQQMLQDRQLRGHGGGHGGKGGHGGRARHGPDSECSKK